MFFKFEVSRFSGKLIWIRLNVRFDDSNWDCRGLKYNNRSAVTVNAVHGLKMTCDYLICLRVHNVQLVISLSLGVGQSKHNELCFDCPTPNLN
jgi:hypothetical protein